jgi:hypothetical protein
MKLMLKETSFIVTVFIEGINALIICNLAMDLNTFGIIGELLFLKYKNQFE